MKPDYSSIYKQISREHSLKFITRPEPAIFNKFGFNEDEIKTVMVEIDKVIEARFVENEFKLFESELEVVDVAFYHGLEDGWYTVTGHHDIAGDWDRWSSIRDRMIKLNIKGNWIGVERYKPTDFDTFWKSVWMHRRGFQNAPIPKIN